MEIMLRRAARVIVLDPRGRVLLAKYMEPGGRGFWATLGGGIREGESEVVAARRELAEEVGIDAGELAPGWVGQARYVFGGRQVVQEEHFFIFHAGSSELPPGLDDARRSAGGVAAQEGILEVRWWTRGGIAASRQTIYPPDLALRLAPFVETLSDDARAELPDVRDGLTPRERTILIVLRELQEDRGGRAVPLAQLYGRVLEVEDFSIAELQAALARLGGRFAEIQGRG